eukprot:9081122-Pyramimonas_sp.AAC.1
MGAPASDRRRRKALVVVWSRVQTHEKERSIWRAFRKLRSQGFNGALFLVEHGECTMYSKQRS